MSGSKSPCRSRCANRTRVVLLTILVSRRTASFGGLACPRTRISDCRSRGERSSHTSRLWLIAAWRLGPRDLATAYDFTHDLADRVSQRVQITTDGLRVYLEAIESAFYEDVDYAVLQKVYGNDVDGARRYSPAKIVSSSTKVIKGTPNPKHISTSYVERLN